MLKGALLPFGARAYLLTVEEPRGPQEGLEVLHRTEVPCFLPIRETCGSDSFGLGSDFKEAQEPEVVVHTCSLRTGEAEAGGLSQV